jgi:hypothetical protein
LQKIVKPDLRVEACAACEGLPAFFKEPPLLGALPLHVVEKGPRGHDEPLEKLLAIVSARR